MSALIHKDEYCNFVNKFRDLKPTDFIKEDGLLMIDKQSTKKETEENANRLRELIKEINELDNDLKNERSKLGNLLDDLKLDLDRLKEFKNVNYLLEYLDKIKNQHLSLNKLLNAKSTVKTKVIKDQDLVVLNAISIYDQMLNDLKLVNDLGSNELVYYLKQIVFYWNDLLIKKLNPIFNSCLNLIKWPAPSILNEDRSYLMDSSQDSLDKFKKFFEAYLKLDESRKLKESLDESSTQQSKTTLNLIKDENQVQIIDKIQISLPLEQMILPLKKRFVFHFQQEAKTNRLDKPEWYLTQIVNWIKNHELFLEEITDPISRRLTKNRFTTKLQFIYVLTGLAKRKIELDLTQLVYDDKLFAHLFDETLIFVNELKNFLEEGEFEIYSELNLVDLFIVEPYLSKLIQLERKKTTSFMEQILNSDNAWNCISNPNIDENLDNFKIPNCVDKFILLLQSISERFSTIQNLECKSQFIRLQLDSIDDFRLRLAQMINNPQQEDKMKWPFYANYFAILNSLNYLIIVLEDWKYQPIFMEISEYLMIDSVFDETLNLLNHLLNEMIQKIILSLMNQIRLKIHQYTKIKWFCLNEDDQELGYASHELFFLISSALDVLKKQISDNLFDKLIRIVTKNLNTFFIDDFILKCTFNEYGVKVLTDNIQTNLIPIFKNFFNIPDDKFVEILDCCKLLNLEKESNEQLKEIYNEDNLEEYIDLLYEFKVKSLEPNVTRDILMRRLFF